MSAALLPELPSCRLRAPQPKPDLLRISELWRIYNPPLPPPDNQNNATLSRARRNIHIIATTFTENLPYGKRFHPDIVAILPTNTSLSATIAKMETIRRERRDRFVSRKPEPRAGPCAATDQALAPCPIPRHTSGQAPPTAPYWAHEVSGPNHLNDAQPLS